ncbi:SDR family NAD(P)-dependent oxidoreductase [Pelagibacterium xiamenense]|uniref:SDR family NAD(P)-dependent oxidoreductase n=1 Tax=Pelagibacterium xiamenense TaxID=2901140 RepID=UPI001E45654A|nr:SDR family NAD(P)-dependent oxidoreductase [Pelagibacterium xiamenense]MCD7059073.1 SDR family NAD(P)-dependent oxidoreductase [Pelagibacterium xiamenense]
MQPVIFITGATSGFGQATARKFASNGWKVIATGRRVDRLNALEDEFPGIVHGITMDLTDAASIDAAVAAIPEGFKPVTCLFNNGGLALGTQPIPDVDTGQWRTMVETNVMGLLHTTLALLPLIKQVGKGASIINTGSIAQRFAYAGGNVYGATKAFVHQFSMNLRTDLAGTGIRITSLEPGHAKSEFTAVRTGGDFDANEKMYADNDPLMPEDIAEAVWWVATLPDHVNINVMEIMPVCQVPSRPVILKRDDFEN